MTKQYSFHGQHEGEKVVILLRPHWLTNFVPLASTVFVFLVPLFVWFFVIARLDILLIPDQIIWIGGLVWFLLGVFFIVYVWLDWYLDVYVVTNERIIDIDQAGIFHRTVGETSLENVQDVIYEIHGVLQTLFNYGKVLIHTAGPTGDIVFDNVSNPQKVQRQILNESANYKEAYVETPATPKDLLNIMLEREQDKLEEVISTTPATELPAKTKTPG
jgi:membrane protein YdbS with pleckstrin-like domain